MLIVVWKILGQMSPWLLLGMAISGVLNLILPAGFIKRRFKGVSGVIQAVAIGVPLPLCSCGVVPTGIGLKNQGADDGASVGFIISTPQTGVDSVLVSMSFFGWPFAIFKMVAALVLGIVGGLIANTGIVRDKSRLQLAGDLHAHDARGSSLLTKFFWHCFDLFESFWFWLLVGVVVSAAIEVWVPQAWIGALGEIGTLPSMLVVLVISIPLYICATASVPLAAALVAGGFPPAAALVFLMAGPATNTTTIGAIYSRFGSRVLATYLSVIVLGSLLSGLMFDYLLEAEANGGVESHLHSHAGWLPQLSSSVVLVLVVFSAWRQLKRRWASASDMN